MRRPRLLAALAPALVAGALACGPPAAPASPAPAPAPDERPRAEGAVPSPPPEGRLGDAVRPVGYDLEIELAPSRPAYAGTVAIDLDVREPVATIWLHASELEISGARVAAAGDRPQPARRIRTGPDGRGLVGVDLAHPLPPGPARLELRFRGELGSRVGLFRQKTGGRWYAFTDFEPIEARRAFPCFDDPRFKVPWRVSLVVPEALTAVANAPATGSRSLAGGKKRVTFARTTPLPSYLVAFAAGPFSIAEGPGEPVPIRVIAPAGRADRADYALAAAPPLLRLAQRYLGGEVPYRKLDFLSVPSMGGAMENPGLVTVAERILLPAPDERSPRQARIAAMVIAHEIAHLWFGDLVTPSYWNDLWLNEAFATWMADELVARWNPAHTARLRAVENRADAMDADLEPDVRPIRAPIRSREDIRAAFGAITYKKGAAVLAMIEAWVGEDRFRDAIRAYLGRHRHAVASAPDLLAAVEEVAGADVTGALEDFLTRPGIPLVRADLRCDGGPPRLEVTQERAAPAGRRPGGDGAPWRVPVCVRFEDGEAPGRTCALVREREASIPLGTGACPAWVAPNAGAAGYYRGWMPEEQLRALAASGALSAREILGLADDLDALTATGEVPVRLALEVYADLAPDAEHRGVAAIVRAIERVGDDLVQGGDRRAFAAYIRRVFGRRAREVGLAPEDGEIDERALVRPALVAFVGDHGADPVLRRRARRLARRWIAGDVDLPRRAARAALTVAARGGDRALFADVLAAFREAEHRTRRGALLAALASFTDPGLVGRALDLAVTDEVKPREALELYAVALSDPRTREPALDHFAAHRRALGERLPPKLNRLAPLVMRDLCGEDHRRRVRELFAGAGSDRLPGVLERIRRCGARRRAHADQPLVP